MEWRYTLVLWADTASLARRFYAELMDNHGDGADKDSALRPLRNLVDEYRSGGDSKQYDSLPNRRVEVAVDGDKLLLYFYHDAPSNREAQFESYYKFGLTATQAVDRVYASTNRELSLSNFILWEQVANAESDQKLTQSTSAATPGAVPSSTKTVYAYHQSLPCASAEEAKRYIAEAWGGELSDTNPLARLNDLINEYLKEKGSYRALIHRHIRLTVDGSKLGIYFVHSHRGIQTPTYQETCAALSEEMERAAQSRYYVTRKIFENYTDSQLDRELGPAITIAPTLMAAEPSPQAASTHSAPSQHPMRYQGVKIEIDVPLMQVNEDVEAAVRRADDLTKKYVEEAQSGVISPENSLVHFLKLWEQFKAPNGLYKALSDRTVRVGAILGEAGLELNMFFGYRDSAPTSEAVRVAVLLDATLDDISKTVLQYTQRYDIPSSNLTLDITEEQLRAMFGEKVDKVPTVQDGAKVNGDHALQQHKPADRASAQEIYTAAEKLPTERCSVAHALRRSVHTPPANHKQNLSGATQRRQARSVTPSPKGVFVQLGDDFPRRELMQLGYLEAYPVTSAPQLTGSGWFYLPPQQEGQPPSAETLQKIAKLCWGEKYVKILSDVSNVRLGEEINLGASSNDDSTPPIKRGNQNNYRPDHRGPSGTHTWPSKKTPRGGNGGGWPKPQR